MDLVKCILAQLFVFKHMSHYSQIRMWQFGGTLGHIIEMSTIIGSYKLTVSVQSVLEEKLVA